MFDYIDLACGVVFLCFFFFFSSRRRHTRSKRDWSSDVCSSDLAAWQYWVWVAVMVLGQAALLSVPVAVASRRPMARRPLRSEERRVGKECRSRWAREH